MPARRKVRRQVLLQMPDEGAALPRLTALATRWRTEAKLASDQHEEIARLFERQLSSSGQFHYSLQAVGARPVDCRCHRRFRFQPSQRALRVLRHGLGLDAPQPGNPVAGRAGLSLRRVGPARPVLPGPPVARPCLGRGLSRSATTISRAFRSRSAETTRGGGPTAAGCGWTQRPPTTWAARPPIAPPGVLEARLHALQHYWERYIADMDNQKQRESVYEPVRRTVREFASRLFSWSAWRESFAGMWGALAATVPTAVSWEVDRRRGADRRGVVPVFGRLASGTAGDVARASVARPRRAASSRLRASVEFYHRFEQVAARLGCCAGRADAAGVRPRRRRLVWRRSAGGRSWPFVPWKWPRRFIVCVSAGKSWMPRPTEAVRHALEELKAGVA